MCYSFNTKVGVCRYMKKLVCGILSILLITNNILSLYAYEETSSSDFFADEIITDVLLEDDSLDENLDMDVEDFSDFNDELELEQEIEIPEVYSDTDFDTSDTISEFAFNPETNTIVAYSTNYAATKDIVIPAQINGYDVLHIGEYAFSARQLKSLTFEEGCKIETIGDYAFYNNFTLEGDVIFPETLTSIGIDAFRDTKIKAMYFDTTRDNITFGKNGDTSYRTVEGGYYYNGGVIEDKNKYGTASSTYGQVYGVITSYDNIEIETALVFSNMTYIEESALLIDNDTNTLLQYFSSHLEDQSHVVVPDGIVSLGIYSFYYDSNITSISFPNSLELVEKGALRETNIEILDFRNTKLTTVGEYAFYDIDELEVCYFPPCLETLGAFVFQYCISLEYVVGLEDTLIKEIPTYAFNGCTSLVEINFTDDLEEIGSYAFYNCSTLSLVVMPQTVHTIGVSSFYSCKGLLEVVFSEIITVIPYMAFYGCSSLVEMTFPQSLIEIGGYGIGYCTKLQIINFNDKLEIIGQSAFSGNTALYQIYDDNNPFPTTIHTIEYNAFSNTSKLNVSVSFPSLEEIGYYTVSGTQSSFNNAGFSEIILPNQNLTTFANSTFSSCTYLESVVLPMNITSMGISTFSYCKKLTSIGYIDEDGNITRNVNKLPEAIKTIPAYTFYYCTVLEVFNVNEDITDIGASTFAACYLLSELRIPATIETIGSSAFSNIKDNSRIYINKPYLSVSGESWSAPISTWIIWDDMEIGVVYSEDGEVDHEFLLAIDEDGNAIITNYYLNNYEVYIPSAIQDINDPFVFYDVVSIADNCFEGSSVKSLYIESGVISIGDTAFKSSRSLSTVYIEDGLLTIGESAFEFCTSLNTVVIGEGIETLENKVFGTCSSLRSLTLPESLTFVMSNVFYYTSSYKHTYLTELRFPGKVEFETGTSTTCALPYNLQYLYLDAYNSQEPYESLENLGFYEKRYYVYYNDTIEVTLDGVGTILYNTDTDAYHKYKVDSYVQTIVDLPSEFIYEDITYYPIKINNYFFMDTQTTTKWLYVPNEIKYIDEYAMYQTNDAGLQRIYLDHEVNAIESAPWSRTYPLFRVVWSGALNVNEFYYEFVDENKIVLNMYLGEQEVIDLNDFNDWVNEQNVAMNEFARFIPVNYEIILIDEYLFYYNEFVKEVTLTESIERLAQYSFAYMDSLETVNFKEGLITIDEGVFRNSEVLDEIILPESVYTIGDYAFYECNGVVNLVLPREMDPTNAFGQYSIQNMDNVLEVVLPDNLKVIPMYFGANLDSLEYMSIPYSVTTIGAYFARGTTYKQYTTVIEFLDRLESDPVQNESWKSYLYLTTSYSFKGAIVYKDRTYQDGFLYSYPQEKVLSYHYQLRYEDDIDIPIIFYGREDNLDLNEINYPKHLADNLLSISTYSMLKYSSVTIPDTIETIGASVFRGSNITEIKMPSKGNYIGTNAFRECKYLESIVLPANITTVYSSTFRGCTSLETVSFNEGITEIQYDAFYATGLIAVQLPNSLETVGYRAFAACPQLESVHFGTNDSQIYNIYIAANEAMHVFYETPKLNNIVIGGTRGMLSNEVAAQSPWGGDYNTVFTFYWGEFVYFEHYVVRHDDYESDIKYYINLWATCSENYIQEIHFPIQDFNVASIGEHTWYSENTPYVYEVNDFGSYRFEGFDNSGFDSSNVFYVFFEEKEIPEVDAVDIYVRPSEVLGLSENSIIELSKANGRTYDGITLNPFISYNSHLSVDNVLEQGSLEDSSHGIIESIEDIWKLSDGESGDFVSINVAVKDSRYNTYDVKEIDIILIDEVVPSVYGDHVTVKENVANNMTVTELLELSHAYAMSADETRELEVFVEDSENTMMTINQLEVGGRHRVTLSTYDPVHDEYAYTSIDVKVVDQGIPLIDASNIYIRESDVPFLTIDLINQLSNPYATCYQGIRELEVEMIYEDLVAIEVLSLVVGDEYMLKYKTYDPIEDESATKIILITVIEGYDPHIYADNVSIHKDDLYEYELLEEEVFELIKVLSSAYAVNYDGSRDLEVLINDDSFVDFATKLLEHEYLAVSFRTEDDIEKTFATTTFMVQLTNEDRPVDEEPENPSQPLIPLEPAFQVDPDDDDDDDDDDEFNPTPSTGDDVNIVVLCLLAIISFISSIRTKKES